jgi:curved DNA-binding protein
MAGPLLSKTARKSAGNNPSLLKSVTSTLGSLLGRGNSTKNTFREKTRQLPDYDTTYHTPLTTDELRRGKTIQVVVYGDSGEQTLKVKIPPNSRNGQKLRIKGKGRPGPFGRGDLYLNLVEQESG